MLKRKKRFCRYALQEMLCGSSDGAVFFVCRCVRKVCVCVREREREREKWREEADYFFEMTHKKLGAMVVWVWKEGWVFIDSDLVPLE